MKNLIITCMLAVTGFPAFAQSNETILPLRELRNEAREVIKEFELTDLQIVVGAPEYKEVRSLLQINIQTETTKLDQELDKLNLDFSMDYSLIMSLKRAKKDPATRRTIEIAKERLISKAQKMTANYHSTLKNLILLSKYQNPLLKKCLTVLCAEKITFDLQTWYQKAIKLNRILDLEVASIDSITGLSRLIEDEKNKLDKLKNEIGKYLPVALTKEQYQDILLENRKKEEAALEQARIASLKLENLKRIENQPFGCEQINEIKTNDVFNCLRPYQLINGVKHQINTLTFEMRNDICLAHGLQAPRFNTSWFKYNRSPWVYGYFYESIECESKNYDSFTRLLYDKKNLNDGSILVSNIKVVMTDGFSKISKYDSSKFCGLLGFRTAISVQFSSTKDSLAVLDSINFADPLALGSLICIK